MLYRTRNRSSSFIQQKSWFFLPRSLCSFINSAEFGSYNWSLRMLHWWNRLWDQHQSFRGNSLPWWRQSRLWIRCHG